jgi:glyoxylase-like metal-dependent hydrolase (beta-lactamase superfamily II)
MRIHHINGGTMRPRGAILAAPHLKEVRCNCLLVEAPDGLVLVDAGLGLQDMADAFRLGISNLVLHVVPEEDQTAVRQVELLGFKPADVKHVICTHLDKDHAGGLSDFPRARVHVTAAEQDAALHPATLAEKERYRRVHFSHGPQWVVHGDTPDGSWKGMDCIGELEGLPDGILLVPLAGHTRGHCGAAVEGDNGWVLHCGDAYYHTGELSGKTPLEVAVFRRIAHHDFEQAMAQVAKLRRLREEGGARLVSGHDRGGGRDV